MNDFKIQVWSKTLKKYLPPDTWYINGNGELFFDDTMTGELIHQPPAKYSITITLTEDEKNI